jgi:hypothetical protein
MTNASEIATLKTNIPTFPLSTSDIKCFNQQLDDVMKYIEDPFHRR